MAFVDRVVEYPGRVKLTPVTGQSNIYDMERAEGTEYTEGTLLNATNLNAQTQLDASVQTIYSNLETDTSKQNDVSNALYFLIQHATIIDEYDSGSNWHVRKWSNGIVEQWCYFDMTGTFTAWNPLSYFDAVSPEAQPVSGGTIINRQMGGYCEGQTTWIGQLSGSTTARFITNGTPSGSKSFHVFLYIVKKV